MARLSRCPLFAWLCLLTQAAAALFFAGLVLCVEADGAVVVEAALAGDCCRSREPGRTPPQTPFGEARCDCTDAPLIGPGVVPRALDEHALAPVLAAVPATVAARPTAQPGASFLAAPDRAVPVAGELRALRSVILLV